MMPEEVDSSKLTDEQIENWREALLLSIGPHALIAPKEAIQAMRDNLQEKIRKVKW